MRRFYAIHHREALVLLKGYKRLQIKTGSYFVSSEAALYTDEKHQLILFDLNFKLLGLLLKFHTLGRVQLSETS